MLEAGSVSAILSGHADVARTVHCRVRLVHAHGRTERLGRGKGDGMNDGSTFQRGCRKAPQRMEESPATATQAIDY